MLSWAEGKRLAQDHPSGYVSKTGLELMASSLKP